MDTGQDTDRLRAELEAVIRLTMNTIGLDLALVLMQVADGAQRQVSLTITAEPGSGNVDTRFALGPTGGQKFDA